MKIKEFMEVMKPEIEYKEIELIKLTNCSHKEVSRLLHYGYKTGRVWRKIVLYGKKFYYVHMKVSKTKIEPYVSKEGHQYYGCGHTHRGIIIADSNALTIAAYLDWKDSVGFEGDKSQCFACYSEK